MITEGEGITLPDPENPGWCYHLAQRIRRWIIKAGQENRPEDIPWEYHTHLERTPDPWQAGPWPLAKVKPPTTNPTVVTIEQLAVSDGWCLLKITTHTGEWWEVALDRGDKLHLCPSPTP